MASQFDVLRGRLLEALSKDVSEELGHLTSDRDRTLYQLAKRKGVVIGLQRASARVAELLKEPLGFDDEERR